MPTVTSKVGGSGTLEDRLARVEQALNYGQTIMGFSAVGDSDPELDAIASLSGRGLLQKTDPGVWSLVTASRGAIPIGTNASPSTWTTLPIGATAGGLLTSSGSPGDPSWTTDLAWTSQQLRLGVQAPANSPGGDLRVFRDVATNVVVLGNQNRPNVQLYRAGGTLASPSSVAGGSNTSLGAYFIGGHDGTSYQIGCELRAVSGEAWTNTAHGTTLLIGVAPTGSTALTTKLTVSGQGVGGGIATTDNLDLRGNDAAFALANTGRIRMFERVTMDFGANFTEGRFIEQGGTYTTNGGLHQGLVFNPSITYSGAPAFGLAPQVFLGQPGFNIDYDGNFVPAQLFFSSPFYSVASGRTAAFTEPIASAGIRDAPIFQGPGTYGTSTYNGFATAFSVESGVTFTNRRGMRIANAGGTGTLTNQIGLLVSALTKGTSQNSAIVSEGTAADSRHAGPVMIGINAAPTTTAGNLLELERTHTLAANIADGFAAGYVSDPGYTGAFTATRHNYWDVQNPSVAGGAAVTDACVMRFDAAIGTHLALAAVGAVAPPAVGNLPAGAAGTFAGWLKINVAGALKYLPIYQ